MIARFNYSDPLNSVGLNIITLVIIAATFFTLLSNIDANIVTALESLIRIRIGFLNTNLELEYIKIFHYILQK